MHVPDDGRSTGGAREDGPSRADVERAVWDANIPTLLMLVAQHTGDDRWLRAPFTPSRNQGLQTNEDGGLPESAQQEVRRAAAAVIWDILEAGPPPVPEPDRLADMLSVAMGEEVPPEYGPMIASELHREVEDVPLGRRIAPPIGEPASAIVIGAGISGICAAVGLQQAGVPFTIIERNDDFGGVWLENTYPGAGVDTPSHLYAFAFAPHPWREHFARQSDVLEYLRTVAADHGLREHTRFSEEVVRASFDANSQSWTVTVRRPDGSTHEITGRFLVSSVGIFNPPSIPDIPGLDDFDGPVIHTAQWPDDGLGEASRIGVIGSGASAMQLVPSIADHVDELVLFQRQPHWIAPFEQRHQPIPEGSRFLLEHVPLYRAWYRLRLAWTFNDRSHAAIRRDPEWPDQERSISRVSDAHRRFFERYIQNELEARPDLVPVVTPDYPPYTKRILLDYGWYRALTLDHVHLETERVDRVTPDGIVVRDGRQHDLDALVLATGYDVSTYLSSYEVVGREGRKLADFWNEAPEAYIGTLVPGFPNFFALYGPNTQPHGGSVIYTIERQVQYMCSVIGLMAEEGASEFEVTEEAWREYNDGLVEEHERLVWQHPSTASTYFRNSRGRVVVLNPYRMVDVWNLTREPDREALVLRREWSVV